MALLLGLCVVAQGLLFACAAATPNVIEVTQANIPAGFKVAGRSSMASTSSMLSGKHRRMALSVDSSDTGKQGLQQELTSIAQQSAL
jgi:hypothetical protein